MAVALAGSSALADLVERYGGRADDAALDREIAGLAEPRAEVGAELLCPVAHPRWVEGARSNVGILLCTPALAPRLPAGRRWIHEHAVWVMAQLLAGVREPEAPAEIAPDARIARGAQILPGARVGPGSIVRENAVIYPRVRLGAGVDIGACAVIGRPGFGFVAGPDGSLVRIPQLGGVLIEDAAEVGALSTVDAGTLEPTVIGRAAKLDAQVHIGHNGRVGAGCFIAAQSGLAGSVTLEPGVVVGGQAGFKDHVRVGAGARVAAKSGVIGDVPPGVTVAGFPAVPRARWLRAMAHLLGRR